MERSVGVFDMEPARALAIGNMLEQCSKKSHGLRIQTMNSALPLSDLLSHSNIDVLFCGARAIGEAPMHEQALALARDMSLAVVYYDVPESSLVDLELTDCAFLLPRSAGLKEVSVALQRALDQRDRHLERPFLVKTRQRSRVVYPSRVSYIESDLRKVRFHLGSETVESYGKLSGLLQKLPWSFVQCHKSFVVNLGYVEELLNDRLVLSTGDAVPVSQKRRRATREALDEYVRNAS